MKSYLKSPWHAHKLRYAFCDQMDVRYHRLPQNIVEFQDGKTPKYNAYDPTQENYVIVYAFFAHDHIKRQPAKNLITQKSSTN